MEKEYGMFEVIHVDPEGSGMEYSGHLGKQFKGARCCAHCTVIFGEDGNFGPFVRGELKPLDSSGKRILDQIEGRQLNQE